MVHPFDVAATIDPCDADDPGVAPKGNAAYYDWLARTIEAATGEPVPWLAVELAILLDRLIRVHEAEQAGGPVCAECIARAEEASD